MTSQESSCDNSSVSIERQEDPPQDKPPPASNARLLPSENLSSSIGRPRERTPTVAATTRRVRRRQKKRGSGYKIPDNLLLQAGSIRSAVSLPGALPTPSPGGSTLSPHVSPSVVEARRRTTTDVTDPLSPRLSEVNTGNLSSTVGLQPSGVVKEICLCCTPWSPVHGVLTATQHALMFEPDLRSQLVRDLGIGRLQVYIDIQDVIACAAVMLPDGPLVTKYFGFTTNYGAGNRDQPQRASTMSAYGSDSVEGGSAPAFFQVIVRASKLMRKRKLREMAARRVRKNVSGSQSANSRAAFSRVLKQLNDMVSQRNSSAAAPVRDSPGTRLLSVSDPLHPGALKATVTPPERNLTGITAALRHGYTLRRDADGSSLEDSPSTHSARGSYGVGRHDGSSPPAYVKDVIRMRSMPLLDIPPDVTGANKSDASGIVVRQPSPTARSEGPLAFADEEANSLSGLTPPVLTGVGSAGVSRPQRLLSNIASWAKRRGLPTGSLRTIPSASELEPESPRFAVADGSPEQALERCTYDEADSKPDTLISGVGSPNPIRAELDDRDNDFRTFQTVPAWWGSPSRGNVFVRRSSLTEEHSEQPGSRGVAGNAAQGGNRITALRPLESDTDLESEGDMDNEEHQTVLFRFSDQLTVRQLTSFAIDCMDARDEALRQEKAQFRELKDLPISRQGSGLDPRKVQESSSFYGRPNATFPVSLTVIPFTSNEVFEGFLLSPEAQTELLANAAKRLAGVNYTHLETPALLSVAFALLRIATPLDPASRRNLSAARVVTEKQPGDDDDANRGSVRKLSLSSIAMIRYPPRIESTPANAPLLLTESVANELSNYLPPSLLLRTWKLGFCTQLHGLSFSTFFRRLGGLGPCVIFISDTRGTLFGGFCSVSLRESSHYYGTGECFVFTFKKAENNGDNKYRPVAETQEEKAKEGEPAKQEDAASPTDVSGMWTTSDGSTAKECKTVAAYSWTKQNSFFVFSSSKTVAFGGGGSYAITVDSNFLRGSSAPCATYGSPCLTTTHDFLIRYLQVWYFGDF